MEETLRVIARLRAQNGKEAALEALLEGLVEATRAEEGCIHYELLRNLEDPAEFTFVEEWRDEAALAAHFEAEHVEQALAAMPDLLAEELDLRKYRLVA
ncbi:MAG: putative quinol monooxygenase [Thermoanaerobaculia bacterium]|nr:putative quinol monooxygenase [Thermoanaerobaculia bacterium]